MVTDLVTIFYFLMGVTMAVVDHGLIMSWLAHQYHPPWTLYHIMTLVALSLIIIPAGALQISSNNDIIIVNCVFDHFVALKICDPQGLVSVGWIVVCYCMGDRMVVVQF